MAAYLLLGAILWIATIASNKVNKSMWIGTLCTVLILLFTGLRYEIGYDWLAYERYFLWLSPSFSFENYRVSQQILPVEYFYFLYNVAIKKIGGSTELLFFLISLFNIIVIDKMINVIDKNSKPFVWLMYFCLALIMVQFNILRQSVASSFVILSLLMFCDRKYLLSAGFFAIALGFHTSVAMFIPLYAFINRRIEARYIVVAIIFSALVFLIGNMFLTVILKTIGALLPGGISEKTDLYATGIQGGNVWSISPLAALLIVFYMAIITIFIKSERDPYVNVAILLTVAALIAHLAFGQVPIIWNRVMCVSLPWQLAVLWKCYISKLQPVIRQPSLFVGGIFAIAVFAFQLSRPENIAFVPYHSLIQVWLFNDEGDGRLRSMYAVQQGQIEQAKRAAE